MREKKKYNTGRVEEKENNSEDTNQLQGDKTLNIMYDKRVFRGNTHGMNILKEQLTPA